MISEKNKFDQTIPFWWDRKNRQYTAPLFMNLLRFLVPILVFSLSVFPAVAQNTNGTLALVEEGGGIALGRIGGTAFALDVIGGGGLAPTHTINNVVNGTYGNASSWIGDSPNSWVGIAFGSSQSVSGVAWGRDNTGAFLDRFAGTYTIQYTTDANVLGNPAGATWNTVGSVSYGAAVTGSLYASPTLRHRFNFDGVNATAIRVVAPGSSFVDGAAIDELEFYGTKLNVSGPASGIVTTASAGYSMAWDGNDGQFFSATGATVPNNIALASNGSTAIVSGELGPQIGVPFHVGANLNVGRYGNGNSWIGADNAPPVAYAGVMFNKAYNITSFAFGRDNGLDNANGECCSGQLTDRWQGLYTLQITNDGSSWTNVGTIDLQNSFDGAIGGLASGYLRHEFDLSTSGGQPITATGLRLLVPATGIGAGTAIDELEVFGTPVPEPALASLLGCAVPLLRRRRR